MFSSFSCFYHLQRKRAKKKTEAPTCLFPLPPNLKKMKWNEMKWGTCRKSVAVFKMFHHAESKNITANCGIWSSCNLSVIYCSVKISWVMLTLVFDPQVEGMLFLFCFVLFGHSSMLSSVWLINFKGLFGRLSLRSRAQVQGQAPLVKIFPSSSIMVKSRAYLYNSSVILMETLPLIY